MMLPKGWTETRIGEVIQLIDGDDPSQRPDEKFYYIDIGSIDNKLGKITAPKFLKGREAPSRARRVVKKGDVLFATVRPYLRNIALVPDELDGQITSTGICVLRPYKDVSSRFLLAWVSSQPFVDTMTMSSDGTMYPAISDEDVRRGALALPPAAEQHRIVAKLDALTARIARARAELDRVAVLGKALRQGALQAAVVGTLTASWREATADVETVSEILARTPSPQQGRGGREATDKIIPGRGGLSVNDPHHLLPASWKWVPLLRLAKQETGHTPSRSKSSYWDGGVPWIGIRDAGAHHGHFIEETTQTISAEGLANSSARLLPAGTVCLSRTASVGYVTIMARSMATSQDFATWTCGPALLPEYLMYALMAEGEGIRTFGMGSTHTTIYFPEIRALHIALPPVAEQREIVARIKAAFTRADRLESNATKAQLLLDRLEVALFAKAFRGDLVPQDPADEPASVLLQRICAERATDSPRKRNRSSRTPVG